MIFSNNPQFKEPEHVDSQHKKHSIMTLCMISEMRHSQEHFYCHAECCHTECCAEYAVYIKGYL